MPVRTLTNEGDAFLTASVSLRRYYRDVRPRRLPTQAEASAVATSLSVLIAAAEDPLLNEVIAALRENWLDRPLSFASLHSILHGLQNDSAEWKYEVGRLSDLEFSQRELRQLRSRAGKTLAQLANNGGQVRGRDACDLTLGGDRPLVTLVGDLSTAHVFPAEGSRFSQLTASQGQHRRHLIQRDLHLLSAMILLVANASQLSKGVFRLSYTLAVGQTCQ